MSDFPFYLSLYKGYGRIELHIYDLQSKCRPSATYPFLLAFCLLISRSFKNLNNKQKRIRIVKQYLRNVNIKYLIQNLSDDFQLNGKLKHVIILFLKIMYLQ